MEGINWRLEDERITGDLKDLKNSPYSSIIVSGHLDIGAFSEYSIDVDDLQQHFYSDQLLNKNTPIKVHAHDNMKEKPFYLELVGCKSEIVATIHGLSTSIDKTPISVCVYELGGHEIACQDAEAKDDDAAVARLATELEATTTIFAKAHVMFPSPGGKGTAKYVTTSVEYTAECTF